MSERTRHLDRDEGRRRAYLLGAVSEKERDELEARFFEDEDEFARLMETQYDLIDAHARGELSADEHAQVEQRLLATPEGRRRALVARALQRHAARSVQPVDAGKPGSRAVLLRALPSAALIAASLAGLVWLGLDNARLRRELTSIDAQRSPLGSGPTPAGPPDRLRQGSGESRQSAEPGDKKRSAEAEGGPHVDLASPESLVANVTLTPRVLRSDQAVQIVQLPAQSRVVQLALPIDERAASFTVALERAGFGRVLTQAGVVPTPEGTVIMLVSRDMLQPGDYEALLWRGSEALADLVGVYNFRITQP